MKMQRTRMILFWLIWITGSVSVSTSAMSYGDHVPYVLDHDQHFARLLNKSEFSRLDQPAVHRIQQNLATVYRQDLNWKRDVRLSSQPLTDSVMGPVTLFWLQRFAYDFKIEPIGNYGDALIDRLETIAEFASLFPQETAILLSAEFADWNDRLPGFQRDLDYHIRQQGSHQALLDLVYRYRSLNEPFSIGAAIDFSISPMYYYQLTADDFKLLQSKEQIMAALLKLENKQFENYALLKGAVSGVLKAYPDLFQRLSPAIKRYYRNRTLMVTKDFIGFLNQAMIGDPFMASLNPVLAELLEKELADTAYPHPILFDKAVQAKILAGIGVCQETSLHNQYILGIKISDEAFLALETDLLNNQSYHGMPEIRKHLKLINALRQRSGACDETEQRDVNAFVGNLYTHAVRPAVALLYKKRPGYDSSATPEWDGGNCGCVLDDLSGTVYGFYPYWLASDAPQTVDFSVLSRVAYYGLSFDAGGAINHVNDDKNKFNLMQFLNDNSAFIQTARKHDSRVDWVIHKDRSYWVKEWKSLDSNQKANVFASLADSIYQLLTQPLSDLYARLTFGAVQLATQGDGVTLDFRGFPDDTVSIDLFNNFYDALTERLKATGGDYFVNIMVLQSELGKGLYQHFNLLERISGIQAGDAASSYQQMDIRDDFNGKILVLLEEPTTKTKKTLRFDIENNGLYGILRELLLRNIIPVIEFGDRNWEQLEDDIVYFKDNFGGMGFWPLPLNEPPLTAEMSGRCEEIQAVSGCLVRHFQHPDRNSQPDSALDRFVCENRSFFWVGLVALTLLSLVLLTSYLQSCRFQGKYKNIFIISLFATIVPALTVALLLLLFDPNLEAIAEGNIPLIAVISIGILVSIIAYRRRQSAAKKPSRPTRRIAV
ncbi:hypothetical protein SAMN05421690_100455 [Nitrosomonas sp. Nm51]|uniref:hypothetical protein n=1 Tax=Nitrosomonas sp. Nm51 TaxID=133720 RepID=UPI0008B7D0F4|nr:hypothetical protein [Nitrosomonas sp. Nm51]SEQ95366.1 hypothetical protein SAMN05421690_100455 [Nitrosomonas sp. Nm51]